MSDEKKHMYGIDVSGWNKVDDYVEASKHIDFAIVKATEGKTNKSKVFEKHINGFKDQGKYVGAYHFAWLKKHGIDEPVQQAKWFVKAVKALGMDSDWMIPTLDVEDAGPGWKIPNHRIIDWCNQWIEVVENELGTMVMFYTFWNFWRYKLKEDGIWDRQLWLASTTPIDKNNRPLVEEPPKPIPGWDTALWQYTHKSRVPGIRGKVDMNRVPVSDFGSLLHEQWVLT